MNVPALYDHERTIAFRWGACIAVGAAAIVPLTASTSVPSAAPDVRASVAAPQSLPPYVRVAAGRADRDPFVPQAVELPEDAEVQAVIFGDVPRAVIAYGGKTILVGIGDTVLGLRVTAITSQGVELSDGIQVPMRTTP
jgi:hypothetical protein